MAKGQLHRTHPVPRLIVGVAYCDSSIPALRALLAMLPVDAGLSVVLIGKQGCQQTADTGLSDEVVGGLPSGWRLVAVERCKRLTENTVFLAGVPSSLAIVGSTIHAEPIPETGHFSPADHLFSSLADDHRTCAVGIVLADENTDGLLGLKTINDAGGMTILEQPADVNKRGVPGLSSGNSGIDHLLPISDIAHELSRYAAHVREIFQDKDAESQWNKQIIEAIPAIAEAVQMHTGHNFKHYKVTTLARRIKRRMQVLKHASVDAYTDVLHASRDEASRLFRDLLISVTSFFRDPEAFEALSKHVLPKLLQRVEERRQAELKQTNDEPVDSQSPTDAPEDKVVVPAVDESATLRVWVPGCATGEEAYTLAILLLEAIEASGRSVRLQIFATDLDEKALQTARAGLYPTGISDDISPERLKRFFIKRGVRYGVSKQLRDCVIFSSHNLISDPPFTRVDLISCRNLLIYLGAHLQKKLIPLFHYALRPNGYLFLGPSESMSNHKELFRTISARYRITQRKSTSIGVPLPHGALRGTMARPSSSLTASNVPVDLHQLGQRIVLDEFSAQWAIVDEDAQLLTLSSDTSRFLKLAEGSFQNNIIRMCYEELRSGLRSAFAEAKRRNRQILHDNLSLHTEAGLQRVMVTVQPMPQVGQDSGLYFVAFQLVGKPLIREGASDGESLTTSQTAATAELVEQLERELASTREDLERAVQELEAANEELKSSNEELLSMNEELHSANEELETSKEEVQASNDALARINSDLENLLRSTDIATIFLDRQGNIRGFTPAIAAIYGLIASDIGRPLAQLKPSVYDMPLLPTSEELIARAEPVEETIQTIDGRWFIRRVLPYSTAEQTFDGSVVTFVDVTKLRESEQRLETALRGGSMSAWEIDLKTHDVWRTEGHDQLFGYPENLPQWSYELFLEHVVPEQRQDVERQFERCRHSLDDWSLECEVIRADGERRWLAARGQPVGDPTGRSVRMFGTLSDVTDRKQYEHALAESEAQVRRIIDNMLGFVGVLDAGGVLRDANETALKAGGLDRSMVEGKPFWECYWWCHDAYETERLKQAIEQARQGQTVRYDAKVRMAGETIIDIDFMLVPVRNAEGTITHLIPSGIDITERKAAEMALRESVAFNRSILESSGDCIKVLSLDGEMEAINRAGLQSLELEHIDQVKGKKWFSLWPEESQPVVQAAFQAARSGGVGRFTEARPTFKGNLKWWDVLVTPITDNSGQPVRLLTISRDVTESRALERAVRESELRFKTLADNIAQFAWMADHDGMLFWYNQRWFDFTGSTLEEMQGEGWKKVHHPDHLERVRVKYRHAVENGLEWEDTFPLRGSDGEYRWFLSRAMPIQDSSGRVVCWFGTNTDISDRIRIEAELDEARRLAEAANQAKSDFLANMSHEIRTPMTAILGFADLLKVSDDEEREKVETIRRNGQFLLELINDILDLSKIEAGKMEIDLFRFSPCKLVEDVCSLMHVRAVESNLNLKVEFVGLIPDVIENDPIRVRQILINLVGNAIKFTHEGSICLRLSYDAHERMLKFSVIDTGIGISHQQQALLFRPFEQGDSSIVRRYGGSGLGLAISQRLAHVLGGHIDVVSDPGKGSTFTLSISVGNLDSSQLQFYSQHHKAEHAMSLDDLSQSSALAANAVHGSMAATGSGQLKVRVLVVDDRRDIRFLTQHFVRQVGGEVLVAENGKQALHIAQQESDAGRTLDIILMDVQMPEMDGLTATRYLREKNYTGPIIALTANAMDSDREACLSAGYTDYLSKPIDAMQLIDMLRRYSTGKTNFTKQSLPMD